MKGHWKWPFPVSPKTVLLAVATGIALLFLLRLLVNSKRREGFQTQSSTEAAIVPAIKLIGKAQEVTPQACEIITSMLTGLTKQLDEALKRDNTIALKTLQSSIAVIQQQLSDMKCAELQATAAAAPNTTS